MRAMLVALSVVALFVVALFVVAGCDAADDPPAPVPPEALAAELGIDRYVGAITPIEESREGAVTTYTFDPAEGPVCMRGAPYRASVRETGSDSLVIFLQGGGACWSGFCLAVVGAPAGVPMMDILAPQLEANPVRDWNVLYLPYCDGSFFAGDAAHDDDINGKGRREHRGLANLTGALEVARRRFASPRRILLAGSSGGAYGLLLAGPLVRHYYPDAELIMMADSGIGLGRDGDPGYIDAILDEFAAADFLPDDCEGCRVEGHITALAGWFLARDPDVRMGLYSSWYDSILARTFLQVPPDRFADALARESRALHAAWPDRFRRFIADGRQHTSLLGNPLGIIGSDLGAVELPEGALQGLLGGDLVIRGLTDTAVDGVTMSAWLGGLVEGDRAVWVDLRPPGGRRPSSPERRHREFSGPGDRSGGASAWPATRATPRTTARRRRRGGSTPCRPSAWPRRRWSPRASMACTSTTWAESWMPWPPDHAPGTPGGPAGDGSRGAFRRIIRVIRVIRGITAR